MSSKDLVVYLRSFATDALSSSSVDNPLAVQSLLTRRKLSLRSYEQQLKRAVRNLGPFIAVGKPGDKLPPLGAARVYLDDADWQKTVTKVLDRAQLVFIHLGVSEGLLWELESVVRALQPEQVIIWLPLTTRGDKVNSEAYEVCRRKSLAIFPCPLPEDLEEGAQFIYFGKTWDPHVLVPRRSRRVMSLANAKESESTTILRLALEGLNRQFALASTPLFLRHPVFWLLILLVVFFLSLFLGR